MKKNFLKMKTYFILLLLSFQRIESLKVDNRQNNPLSIDWRDELIINPIKDQGQCGSCWAFSAVGVIEPFSSLASNQSPPPLLSEQNLVDCVGAFLNDNRNGNGKVKIYNKFLIKLN
jgi:hypothetical protein